MQTVMSASPNYVILRHSSGHNYMNRTTGFSLFFFIAFVMEKLKEIRVNVIYKKYMLQNVSLKIIELYFINFYTI